MGISRDSWHKRRKTGGKRVPIHKKRKFELGRPAANTKVSCTNKTRIIDTIYNATSNELVRTKTLVKGAIVAVDAVPFRQWYETHYALPLGRKKGAKLNEEEEARLDKSKVGKSTQKKYEERAKTAPVEPHLIEQFQAGRLLARIASRPGQSGRADGYILEGKELEFYLRKIRVKKAK
uniref:Small ribosomal subunit protein eS8 n=1 Tax=Panagrolaimus davidi TaxID=227884 RepID=A0A914P596_9BILA